MEEFLEKFWWFFFLNFGLNLSKDQKNMPVNFINSHRFLTIFIKKSSDFPGNLVKFRKFFYYFQKIWQIITNTRGLILTFGCWWRYEWIICENLIKQYFTANFKPLSQTYDFCEHLSHSFHQIWNKYGYVFEIRVFFWGEGVKLSHKYVL